MGVPFVGLTGGLGAGKSTALEALGRLGAMTLSTDQVVHDLYASDPAVLEAVVERWGPGVAPGGSVDRAAVAGQAFRSPEERAWLEQLIWPRVAQRVIEFRAAAEAAEPAPPAAVVETPLLFEAGMADVYDATIAVIADEEVRAERAAGRGHAAVDERAARQLSQQEKATLATYVVLNSGSIADLEAELSSVLVKLTDSPHLSSMSSRSASTRSRPAPSGRRSSRSAAAKRPGLGRLASVLVVAVLAGAAAVALAPLFHHAVTSITLPLRHEDIIRQQAREKGIDPSLIAGVIYAESHFRDDQTSSAGAEGLMQITPATAKDIARKSGGIAFKVQDLGTPQVNISYGAYYLRYLLRRYQSVTLALAAYNGGEGNVDRWIARHGGIAGFQLSDIPFAETRAYVDRVEDAQAAYRRQYRRELGL